jgi:hypothetical protein
MAPPRVPAGQRPAPVRLRCLAAGAWLHSVPAPTTLLGAWAETSRVRTLTSCLLVLSRSALGGGHPPSGDPCPLFNLACSPPWIWICRRKNVQVWRRAGVAWQATRAARAMLDVTISAEGSHGVCVRSPQICNRSYTPHAAQCGPSSQSHAGAWSEWRQDEVRPWRVLPPPRFDNPRYVNLLVHFVRVTPSAHGHATTGFAPDAGTMG